MTISIINFDRFENIQNSESLNLDGAHEEIILQISKKEIKKTFVYANITYIKILIRGKIGWVNKNFAEEF